MLFNIFKPSLLAWKTQLRTEQEITDPPKGMTMDASLVWYRRADVRIGIVLVLVYFYVALFTIPHYGLTWDAAWENYYGDKSLNFYAGFDHRHLDMTVDSVGVHHADGHPNLHDISNAYADVDVITQPHLIWPLGPMAGSLTKYLFFKWIPVYSHPYDAHHLAPVLAAVLLVALLYVFVLKVLGQWPAIVAALVVAVYPRFWAHAHFNPKDTLSTLLFSLVILSCYVAVQKRCWIAMLGSSVLWGLALAAKANALFAPVILGPWFLLILWRRHQSREPLLGRRAWIALAVYPLVGLIVMLLCWPYLWVNFPERLGMYVESLLLRGAGGDGTWNLWPLRNALATMPVAIMVMAAFGLARGWFSGRQRPDALAVLVQLWLVVPVLRVLVPGAKDFDGIRHWLEFVPALAIVAGWGAGWLIEQLQRLLATRRLPMFWRQAAAALALAILFTPTLVWHIRNHPNQLVYYNQLVGGLAGAQDRGYPQATDYWGNVYLQGVEWINRSVAMEEPTLVVGVAEHILFYSYQIDLDRRVRLIPSAEMTPEFIAVHDRPIYLMYITREGWYGELVRYYQDLARPVWQVDVDGGVILRILRIDPPNLGKND